MTDDETRSTGSEGVEPAAAPDGRTEPPRCGYRRCRKPLPPKRGRGRRFEFCPEEVTSWPAREGSATYTCRDLGGAERTLAAVQDTVTVPDTAVVNLAEHVTTLGAVLAPLQEFISRYSGDLDTVAGMLDGAVAGARAERDQALEEAAAERGARDAADQRARDAADQAEQAHAKAARARRDASTAEQAAAEAEEARRRAETGRHRAEAAAEKEQQRAERERERADAQQRRADTLDHQLAAAHADLRTLGEALEEERQRAMAETDRANQAIGEAATRIEQLHAAHAERLDQVRREAAAETERRVDERAAAVRRELEQARSNDAQRHAAEVADLNRKIGTLDATLAETTTTLQATRHQLATTRAGIREAQRAAQRDDTDTTTLAADLTALLAADPEPGER